LPEFFSVLESYAAINFHEDSALLHREEIPSPYERCRASRRRCDKASRK